MQRKPWARSRWVTAERRRRSHVSRRLNVGLGHRCPLPPQSHPAPAGSMEGLGGAGWRWRPQPPETRPRVGSLPGGNAPAPKPAGAGNPVESCKARPSAKPKPGARPATGARGFPAHGVAREAQSGRHGAPSPLGTRAASRHPNCRPGVQTGERRCWPPAAWQLFVPPVHLPPYWEANGGWELYGLSTSSGDNPWRTIKTGG